MTLFAGVFPFLGNRSKKPANTRRATLTSGGRPKLQIPPISGHHSSRRFRRIGDHCCIESNEVLPPFPVPLQKYRIGESVTRHVFLRYRLPTAVFDGNAGFVADRLELHLYFGRLTRRKSCLSPCEGEANTGFPDSNSPDLEDFALRARLSEPGAETRFEGNHTGRARCESGQRSRAPPNSISHTNTSKARSGTAPTRSDTRIREVTGYAPYEP
jgi:hypothetical protein